MNALLFILCYAVVAVVVSEVAARIVRIPGWRTSWIMFLVFGIGAVLLWTSLFLSYRGNALYQASGGFPFIAFHYPVPSMGNDAPPIEQWPFFFANLLIWFGIAATVVRFVTPRMKASDRIAAAILLIGIVSSIVGLLYIIMQFD